jgi:hypothetical protein
MVNRTLITNPETASSLNTIIIDRYFTVTASGETLIFAIA